MITDIDIGTTGYYYTTLSRTEKSVYNRTLSSWINERRVRIVITEKTQSGALIGKEALLRIVKCVLLDHPCIFNLNSLQIEVTYLNDGLLLIVPSLYSEEEFVSAAEKLHERVRDIAAFAEQMPFHRDKADYLIGLLSENMIYDTVTAKVSCRRMAHEAVGPLLNGAGTCAGAAKAFALLCDACGIENRIVTGFLQVDGVQKRHMWNLILPDGMRQYVDIMIAVCGGDGVTGTDCYFFEEASRQRGYITDQIKKEI